MKNLTGTARPASARSIGAGLICLAALGLGLLLPAAGPAAPKSQFTLPALDGEPVSLREALEKGPVVLDFWATWCKPCIKSLPALQKVAREFEERGVGVYTVNVDGPRNQPKVRPFLKRHRLELPVLLDHSREVMKQFQLSGMPATILFSTEGEVVYKHFGYKPGDEIRLREELTELLQGAEPDSTKGGVDEG